MAFEIYMVECPMGRRYVGCKPYTGPHWSIRAATDSAEAA